MCCLLATGCSDKKGASGSIQKAVIEMALDPIREYERRGYPDGYYIVGFMLGDREYLVEYKGTDQIKNPKIYVNGKSFGLDLEQAEKYIKSNHNGLSTHSGK